ncbi:sorbosone dehydrogenase family protein [Parvularcula sp. LCG005]|uniref:PQQ-dependent sugar dehydrogenase n=1 Tax=Parvularcula sp. LCG005 TaxID=3078805 RepID=UPI002941C8A7|nr:sorbosone dehydrogenase family protein [Parvularcula sp. LCG005]WOI53905.1 sorbosone dehydrogenase family protein [Parvularcula sp. LCG005]
MSAKLTMGLSLIALTAAACSSEPAAIETGYGSDPVLPQPEDKLIPTVKVAKATGWPAGEMPTPASGLKVNAFATGLDHPRWIYVLPNGDVLVAESNAPKRPEDGEGIRGFFMKRAMEKAGAGVPSADRITILRDTDDDGVADIQRVFLDNLHSPFGMTLIGDTFYVANTDAIVTFPYTEGSLSIDETGSTLTELPAGAINHHWTKNIIASEDGTKLYATVGSNSNVGENGLDAEDGRAAIWEVDAQTGEKRLFATGLRNPNGMDWNPDNQKLWTVVNERDELGDNLVPDYATSVEDGAFYGWPWSYYGDNVDRRVKPPRPDMVERAIAPDYALGSHTASLGLTFVRDEALTPKLSNGMFIGQHGSWNREPRSGYKVVFVPFADGMPSGNPVDVLTGFLDEDKARGRPVDVDITDDGTLLVSDDVGNTIWRVSAAR